LVKIEWTEAAIKDLQSLDKPITQRILTKVAWFFNNFEKVVPEPLIGKFEGAFKLRIGDWRVIYTVEGKTIVIQFIGHRREIYNIK